MQASRRSWRIGQEEDVEVYFFSYDQTLQYDAMHLIAAKMAASTRVNGDQIQDDSLAELDELTNSDMISALAHIVTNGNRATQSLSDAFASANKEFGMADRMIGGYEVTDEAADAFEEEKGVLSVDSTKIIDVSRADTGTAYQLPLMEHAQDGHHNGYQNGHHNGHHQNGHHQNDHRLHYLDLISPPQLEMDLVYSGEVNSKKPMKRRSKFHRSTSLLQLLQPKK